MSKEKISSEEKKAPAKTVPQVSGLMSQGQTRAAVADTDFAAALIQNRKPDLQIDLAFRGWGLNE